MDYELQEEVRGGEIELEPNVEQQQVGHYGFEQTTKMEQLEPKEYAYEKRDDPDLADVIYFFTGKDKKGIKVNVHSKSLELIDEFLVDPKFDEVDWDENINKPGEISLQRVLGGNAIDVRTFIVTEGEMEIIKGKLEEALKNGEQLTYLDLKKILYSLMNNNKIENVRDEGNIYYSDKDDMDVGNKFNM